MEREEETISGVNSSAGAGSDAESPLVREKARSTMPSNKGIKESLDTGCCKSVRL